MVGASFSLGEHTLRVPMELHSQNRRRLCAALKRTAGVAENATVLLQGGETNLRYCCDTEEEFRQESYFHWAFGVPTPDCFGCIEVATARATLFHPRMDEVQETWTGPRPTHYEIKTTYCVDDVKFTDEIAKVIKSLNSSQLLLLRGVNSDSGKTTRPAAFDGMAQLHIDYELLYPVISELRVFKTPLEIEVIRYSNKISSEAHKEVMRKIRPGMKEYQCEAIFRHFCYYMGGCRHLAYPCICGSGPFSAILHYGLIGRFNHPGNRTLKDGDICLFDMGAEYYCYCSDVARSYPANGVFTDKQRAIYNTVLNATLAVKAALKPGVSWVDMHLLADRVTLKGLKAAGILTGSIDDMMKANLTATFQPEGLGHFIGCDVHDVGGYLAGTPMRHGERNLKSLRTARTMKAGMVITIEPGCYFIEYLLNHALEDPVLSQFLVPEVVEEYRDFGGIRISDDMVITENGIECLTLAPRTVEEIEALMAEGRRQEVHVPQLHAEGKLGQ